MVFCAIFYSFLVFGKKQIVEIKRKWWKTFYTKKLFYRQKHKKKSISKNRVKSRLTLLFKELWSFFVFRKKKIYPRRWLWSKLFYAIFIFIKNFWLFIPRREVRTHSPDGVHLKVFPIYIALVNENWGFKNTNANRPFSNHRKPLSPEGKCLSTLPMGSNWFSLQLFLDR